MGVDEAWKEGRVAEIDGLGQGVGLRVRAHLRDAAAFHEHGAGLDQRTFAGIEQTLGAKEDPLRRPTFGHRRRREEGE